MPQLVAAALIGAGVYAGIRWLQAVGRRVKQEMARAEAELKARAATGVGAEPKDLGQLEFDPASGEYRPRRG